LTDLFVIFTTSAFHCKYCVALKELLNVYGFDFYERDIVEPENKTEFHFRGFNKVPQVFHNDKYVGGYSTTRDYLRAKFFEGHPRREEILIELEKIIVE
jgi:glutaredoxin